MKARTLGVTGLGVTGLVVIGMVATGCSMGRTAAPPPRPHAATLIAYNGCSGLLDRIKAEARSELAARPSSGDRLSIAGSAEGASAVAAGVSAVVPTTAPTVAHSTTNNQEAGADEPDTVKTDGRLMVVVRESPLGIQVVDVSSSRPRLAGFLGLPQLGYNLDLLLVGGDAVAIGRTGSSTNVAVIDLADPNHPTVVRSFSLPGDEGGARLIAGRVVLVLRTQPAMRYEPAAINSSTLSDWLPNAAPDCRGVYYPATASGLGSVSVVSLDPSSSQIEKGATVVGDASVVYASTSALYVATEAWQARAPIFPDNSPVGTTDIHGFDLSDPTKPRYIGSGSVQGTLTDQYAMSEDHGYLRVATTLGQPTPPPFEGAPPTYESDNLVTVLHPSSGQLVEVGRISGLGRGERIYGVRFAGNLGYVVTFRQTDPLFVLDLSDPRHPRLRGQLQLTGYSSYLHPLGGGLLFGIGQDVNQLDRTDGVQASVFDVSDPDRPSLRSRLHLPGAFGSADSDHHAFLWWAPSRMIVVPVDQFTGSSSSPFFGEVAFKVSASGELSELGRIAERTVTVPPVAVDPPAPRAGTVAPTTVEPAAPAPAPGVGAAAQRPVVPTGRPFVAIPGPSVQRAVVIGDLLYTFSEGEIVVSRLNTLAEVARLTYQ